MVSSYVSMCYVKFWLYIINSRSLVNICLRPHNESQVEHPQYWFQISQRTSELFMYHQSALLFRKSTSQTLEFVNIVSVEPLSSCLDYKNKPPLKNKLYHIKKKKTSTLCLSFASRWGILWDASEHVCGVWCSLEWVLGSSLKESLKEECILIASDLVAKQTLFMY